MNEQKKFNSPEHGMYVAKEKVNPEDVEVKDPEPEIPVEEIKIQPKGAQKTFVGDDGAYVAKAKVNPKDREVGVDNDEETPKESDQVKETADNTIQVNEVPAVKEDGTSATEVPVK